MKNLLALTFLSFAALGQASHLSQHNLAQTFTPVDEYEIEAQVDQGVDVADQQNEIINNHEVAFAEASSDASLDNSCWKKASGRGFGKIPTSCPAGYTLIGAICYQDCQSGYSAGYTQCYQ